MFQGIIQNIPKKKHYVKYMKYTYKNQEARKFVKKKSTNRKH